MIVVLGQRAGGAAIAAVNGGDNKYNLNHLLSRSSSNCSVRRRPVTDVVKKIAEMTATSAASICYYWRKVAAEKVKIVPAYYNLGSGAVDFLKSIPLIE